MTARTALIFVIAFVCAVLVGLLTYMTNGNVPGAVLAGLVALGGASVGLHQLVR